MVTIELDGREYKMPEGWHEINVLKFEKLIKHFGLLAEFKSQYQYAIELFAILCEAPYDDLKRITRGSFETLAKRIEWTSGDIPPTGVKRFTIKGVEYMTIRDLNALEMGDVVSLELQIKNSPTWEILTNILPILIRKVKRVERADGTIEEGPEDFDAERYEETKDLFRQELMVADVNELKSFF